MSVMLRTGPGGTEIVTGFSVGIDPGLGGAISFLSPDMQDLLVFDTPTLRAGASKNKAGKNIVDIHALARIFTERRHSIAHVYIENVSAMPGQGVVSMFNFGKTLGLTIGTVAALGIPYSMVTPVQWKRELKVPSFKDGAIARASQLLPQFTSKWTLKKHDGRAEAAMIALWGLRSMGHQQPKNQETKNGASTLADLLA